MLIDALSVLCAQLTRDLLAIAKFLYLFLSLYAYACVPDWLGFAGGIRQRLTFGPSK